MENKDLVPGIGMSGTVMCPYGFQKSPCLKGGCEFWVELVYVDTKVARCAMAWTPLLMTELRTEISKLRNDLKDKMQKS